MLPENLIKLVAAGNEPDVVRLSCLAQSMGMLKALRDWPFFRHQDEVYEKDEVVGAAAEACIHCLMEPMAEGTEMTNSKEAFSLLFVQTYVGAYRGVNETALRSSEEIEALLGLVRHRTEADAIAVLAEIAELTTQQQ